MTQLENPEIPAVPAPPLTPDERAELERLRREVGTLRTAAPPPKRSFRWRSLFAVLLIVLGCVLAPVAGLAVWTNNQVSDTARFVRSISPLIEHSDVQAGVADRVPATLFQFADVRTIADYALN